MTNKVISFHQSRHRIIIRSVFVLNCCTCFNTHLIESLAVVDSHNRSNHLRNDDHVTQVSLHNSWLLKWWRFLLCFAQLLDESQWLAFQAARETSACTAMHQLGQLLVRHV